MRSRAALASGLALLLASSCGMLGSKDEPGTTLDFPSPLEGCLDHAGDRLEKYYQGKIAPSEWSQAWDCTHEALRMLNRYSGVESGGYTQENIRTLITSLILTDSELPADFMPAVFELKASLIGGSKDLLSLGEVEQLMKIILVLRDESLKLLPLLSKRNENGGPANQLAFSRALAVTNAKVGAAFPKQEPSAVPLHKETVAVLLKDLAKILKWKIPDYLPDALYAAKTALLGGSSEKIEPETWQVGFETLGAVGAPLLALTTVNQDKATGPNAYGEFMVAVATDVESALEKSIERRGGMIPAVDIDRLIDALPDSIFSITKPTLKVTLRASTGRILGSVAPGALDKPSLQRALSHLSRWNRGKTLLDKVYAQAHLSAIGASRDEILAALSRYEAAAPEGERPEIDRLASVVTHYWPLFMAEDDTEISLAPQSQYSRNHLTQLHWMNLAIEVAIHAYSSSPDRSFLTFSDFVELYEDFKEFGIEMNVIDPTVPNFDRRRFREADFYMPVSDGDSTITLEEGTYYIAFLRSIGSLARRVREDVEPTCKMSDTPGAMGWLPLDPDCFRNIYFSRVEKYWIHAPAMLEYFQSLGKTDDSTIRHDIEHVARLRGYSEEPMGGYDVKAFASVLHYVETLFNRFDHDFNGRFNTAETLETSKIFANIIAQSAGIDPSETDKIEAIYTYIIKNGKKPDPGIAGTLQVGAWLLVRPFWNLNAPRTQVYRGLAVFATSSQSE